MRSIRRDQRHPRARLREAFHFAGQLIRYLRQLVSSHQIDESLAIDAVNHERRRTPFRASLLVSRDQFPVTLDCGLRPSPSDDSKRSHLHLS